MSRALRPLDLGIPGAAPETPPEPAAVGQPHPQLQQLATLLRSYYYFMARAYGQPDRYGQQTIPMWDGGTDKWGVQHTSIWPRMAMHVLRLSVDPLTYVQAQFHLADHPRRLPLPNQMLNEAAVAKYRQFVVDQVPRLQRAYRAYLCEVQDTVGPMVAGGRWTHAEALTYALHSTLDVQAPPLFRYCLAMQQGLPAVAAAYYEAALTEYVCQSAAYDAAWGSLIPLPLRTAGQQVREQLRV